jgi:hypothetical protein
VKVDWVLYTEEPLSVDSLLGAFFLVVDRVSVGCRDTYVDGWLAATIGLITALRHRPEVVQELIDEPVRLRASRSGSRATFVFDDISIVNIPIAELEDELRRACERFLAEVRKSDPRASEELTVIETFVAKSIGSV